MFLGVDAKAIGQIGGGKRCVTGWVDVAMIQSLLRDGEVDEIVTNYGHVIVDECHHLPAVSFERVLAEVRAPFVLGLTATPYRRDGHQPIIHMQCGPVRYVVDPRRDGVRRPFVHRLISRQTGFRTDALDPDAGIQGLYAALADDEERSKLILNDIIAAVDEDARRSSLRAWDHLSTWQRDFAGSRTSGAQRQVRAGARGSRPSGCDPGRRGAWCSRQDATSGRDWTTPAWIRFFLVLPIA